MKCIVCENEITEVHMNGHVFYVGVVGNVNPGYGSSHDLRQIRMGVCDVCLSEAEKNKTIEVLKEELNWSDY